MRRTAGPAMGLGLAVCLFAVRAGGEPPDSVPLTTGKVDVPRPADAGWECLEKAEEGEAPVRMVKCRRAVEGEFLFLVAKEYIVAPASIKPAKELALEVYRKQYESLFEEVRYTADRPVRMGRLAGHEATLDARHARKGPVHKVERVFVDGRRVFNVSAEGSPQDFQAHKAAIDRWLEGTRFLPR